MAPKGYVSFALPAELVERIDKFLEGNTWGYRSRAEMVAAAVREFLQRQETGALPKGGSLGKGRGGGEKDSR